MADQIYRVSSDNPLFKGLIYGEPGSGKTTFACSAQDHPAMRNVLVANIEGGLLSVAHRGDIDAVDIRKTPQVEELFWSIVKGKDKGQGKYADVNTAIIDNATELQAMNLDEIVQDAIANGKDKSRGGKPRSRDDIWQEDYGTSTVQLKRLFRWFRQLPINVMVTAHVKEIYPKNAGGQTVEGSEPIAVRPYLTNKLGESVMGYMDFVWYMYFDEEDTKYKILTRTEGVYFAKTRGPRFREALGVVRAVPERGALAELYDMYVDTANNPPATPRKKKTRKEA